MSTAPADSAQAAPEEGVAQRSWYIDDAYYATLLEDVAAFAREGTPVDAAVRAACEALLFKEARILDDGRLEDWLELFTDECLYWQPSTPGGGDPRHEVSLTFDDRRRLLDRVVRLRTGVAWSQIPASRTRRLLTNVEVWEGPSADQVRVRSNFVIYESRVGDTRAFAGWYGHVLAHTAAGWRIARKMSNLIDSDRGLENISFVL
ncbi:MAG: aromatic-ring-hydroxylating dioxygenase subunit beta [Candidatus Binatia bacterium]